MKISILDKHDSGILSEFARVIGATVQGRFINIPENKGSGYLTGFSWGNELRMMIRNYHLKEDMFVEWTNEAIIENENVVFLLRGILPSTIAGGVLSAEQPHILICKQGNSSIIEMPSNTVFGSVTIRASCRYLNDHFGQVRHPLVSNILASQGNFVFETGVSSEILRLASELLQQRVPESLESHFYRLKCEELLCFIFSLVMQREAVAASNLHADDIKAIYALKFRLQSQLHKPPNIAAQAIKAGMSEPKLRKLFRQTFGKGVFEYYQSARMQQAAKLLKEKHLTVSEAGYQMGFTNLSHFSRVFEQHIGMKPKKYAAE